VKIILFLSVLTVWLVLCLVFLGKMNGTGGKTGMTVLTVILFILIGTGVSGILAGSGWADGFVRESAVLADEYIKINHNNLTIVHSGIEISEIPDAVNDLDSIVPQNADEFGISGAFAENIYQKLRVHGFDFLRSKPQYIIRHAEPDGKITSTSVVRALEWEVLSIISRFVFWVVFFHSALMVLYLGLCIYLGLKKTPPRTLP